MYAFADGSVSHDAAGKELRPGDTVQITTSKKDLPQLQIGHGGCGDRLTIYCGKFGTILFLDKDSDVFVQICGDTYCYNPKALTKVTSGKSESISHIAKTS